MIRERSTGSYRVGPYFLAKSMSDMGLYTVAPMLYATAVYWCVGLRADVVRFIMFLLIFMLQVRSLESRKLVRVIGRATSEMLQAHAVAKAKPAQSFGTEHATESFYKRSV